MLTQQDLKKAILTYKQGVTAALSATNKICLPKPVTLAFYSCTLTTDSIKSLANKIVTGGRREDKGSEFIYLFQMNAENTITTQQTLDKFNAAKNSKVIKNLCKANDNHLDTNTLYVGRSYSPRERLKQHLSSSQRGPYALHLEAWAKEFDLKLDFYLYQFRNSNDRTIQVIEDSLWDHLKPLLGRRGER